MRCDTYAMGAVLAYGFRVYPDAKRRRETDERLVLAKDFYNPLLENTLESRKYAPFRFEFLHRAKQRL